MEVGEKKKGDREEWQEGKEKRNQVGTGMFQIYKTTFFFFKLYNILVCTIHSTP